MAKAQILVVEDESIIAEDIRMSLQNLGYAVPSVVSSGEMAIKKAKENKPDLVLMDIVLYGGMDGIEAANRIRSDFNIPVIYLTAYSDEKILERAKVTEPYGYVIKPFKERELQINIEIALYKHKIENELRESKEFYENVLESIVTSVWVTDKNDVIIYANKGMARVIGTPISQIVGLKVSDFQEFFKPYYLKARETLQPFYYEAVPFVIPGKSTAYQSGWLIPRIKDGNFDGMICTIESIPKYTQAE